MGRAGLSVEAMRVKTGLSPDTIVRARRGDNVTIGILRVIAKALNVHPKHLLDESYMLPRMKQRCEPRPGKVRLKGKAASSR